MARVEKTLQDAVESGIMVGYSLDQQIVTCLKYKYKNETHIEFPLLVNESNRQWRCWVTESDKIVHRSSGLITGRQKELKAYPPKDNSTSLESAIASAFGHWIKQHNKGYTSHRETGLNT